MEVFSMNWLVKLAFSGSREVKDVKRTHKQTDDGQQVKKRIDLDYKINWPKINGVIFKNNLYLYHLYLNFKHI